MAGFGGTALAATERSVSSQTIFTSQPTCSNNAAMIDLGGSLGLFDVLFRAGSLSDQPLGLKHYFVAEAVLIGVPRNPGGRSDLPGLCLLVVDAGLQDLRLRQADRRRFAVSIFLGDGCLAEVHGNQRIAADQPGPAEPSRFTDQNVGDIDAAGDKLRQPFKPLDRRARDDCDDDRRRLFDTKLTKADQHADKDGKQAKVQGLWFSWSLLVVGRDAGPFRRGSRSQGPDQWIG